MNDSFRHILREATRLTRAGHLREATAVIQRALRGTVSPAASSSAAPRTGHSAATPHARPAASPTAFADTDVDTEVIDVQARVVDTGRSPPGPAPAVPPGDGKEPVAGADRGSMEPFAAPSSARDEAAATLDGLTPETVPSRREAPSTPASRFASGSFTNEAGTRPYKLFVPGASAEQPRPLLVLLHGCKQNPDDFAAGTRMNELAQAQGWVVLYPGQPHTANGSGCWNWFQAADQQRERGEPAILAGMTRHVIATQDIDPARVYVAGLSAGGAMAATLAATHSDLFAAVGIHSGLPHGAAHDLMTALSVMRQGPPYGASLAGLPAIVFHGDHDRTVHPSNGEALIAQVGPTGKPRPTPGPPLRVETGRAPGGHRYTRSIQLDPLGRTQAEHWLVHGAGHAWSGGSAAGSYTDPRGPDASAEMLRFFAAYRVVDGAARAA